MAQHTPDVEPLLQFLQVRGIDIDDGDVVFLPRQAVGDGRANLSGTEDDNFHQRSPLAAFFGSTPRERSFL